MSEVTFAKSFLATLDKRPIKLPADHVSDPRKYESQSPYILPRQTHPFPRKTHVSKSKQEKTVNVTMKPMKAGEVVKIESVGLDSTVFELKKTYAERSGVAVEKVKVLLNKKPVGELKTLKEVGVDGEAVEFGVMVMGGGTPTPQSPAIQVPTASVDKMEIDEKAPAPESEKATMEMEVEKEKVPETAGAEDMLKTEEFWSDLGGFLEQRLRDEEVGRRLTKTFRDAWSKR